MKKVLVIISLVFSITTYGQQINADQWDEEAQTNSRLLPKYGHKPKTEEQKKLDQDFINRTIQLERFKGDRTAASHHMIKLGFNYLYRGDLKTAMYRFNQAYLLDSLNNDIYWGFGAVYMALKHYDLAKQQYEEGLTINAENTLLLTDYGTYFLARFYELKAIDTKSALANLNTAISYLLKSYQLDSANQHTSFKLSICYWNKDDCTNAWKYYDETAALGGETITAGYTADLKQKCKREK